MCIRDEGYAGVGAVRVPVTSDPSTKDDAEQTLAAIEGRIDF